MIDVERFWRHCMLLDDSPDSCWIWTGALKDDGMIGRYFTEGGEITAHRAAYEIIHGHIPLPGLRLLRYCAHPQCVRHWKQGGLYRKLSVQDLERIKAGRLLERLPERVVARMFHISKAHVYRLKNVLTGRGSRGLVCGGENVCPRPRSA